MAKTRQSVRAIIHTRPVIDARLAPDLLAESKLCEELDNVRFPTSSHADLTQRREVAKLILSLGVSASWPERFFLTGDLLKANLTLSKETPVQATNPQNRTLMSILTSVLLWDVLLVFIATSLLVERFSCKYLCPLGAVLAIFNKISPVRLRADFASCNRCGRCDVECSMGIQDVPDNLDSPECIRCLECLETCSRGEALTLRLGG